MADARDLGSRAARRRGSSPLSCNEHCPAPARLRRARARPTGNHVNGMRAIGIQPQPTLRRPRGALRTALAAAFFSCLLPAGGARADALWLDNTSGAPLFANARITKVEKGTIYFVINGNETSRELAKIGRISVDDEPALTAAETAYAAQKWDDAVDGYERVVRATAKPWARDWATTRLIDAAAKSGRFDSAVTGYLALVQKDPTAAAMAKPALPPGKSTYLDTAVQQVDKALSAGQRLSDEQKTQLLTFLIELHAARGDAAAGNAAAERLDEILARDPNNPAAARAAVRRKLQSAERSLATGKPDEAISAVEMARDLFVEPADQAEAMFLVAEARNAKAQAPGADRLALQDAALAYMRVAANFKDAPGRPRVAAALAKAAELCARLNEKEAAIRLYDEVARDFPDDPAAGPAAQAAARLRSGS